MTVNDELDSGIWAEGFTKGKKGKTKISRRRDSESFFFDLRKEEKKMKNLCSAFSCSKSRTSPSRSTICCSSLICSFKVKVKLAYAVQQQSQPFTLDLHSTSHSSLSSF